MLALRVRDEELEGARTVLAAARFDRAGPLRAGDKIQSQDQQELGRWRGWADEIRRLAKEDPDDAVVRNLVDFADAMQEGD